jgi:cytochrome c-type biogenesis protein CcmH/NrfG
MSRTTNQTSIDTWTSRQAYTIAVICLLLGIAGGWLFRGSQMPAHAAEALASPAGTQSGMDAQPTPDQLKKMADVQARPLLDKLSSDPQNPDLLATIGNIYYDVQQYATAVDFYQRALKAQPSNAGVRTDMATAYWYEGDADRAIAEFNKALSYQPTNPNTLFNLGIVKWQGKMDINGAVAAWQKLIDSNPKYENKDKVVELIAQARNHTAIKPGQTAKPLPQ